MSALSKPPVRSGDGYSPVVVTDGAVRVELGADHPGVSDPAYRRRRDEIAACSASWSEGEAIPRIDYTDEEHALWRLVCGELARRHRRYACASYLAAAERLALPTDHVPQLEEVSERLAPLTGFEYRPVAGLAPLRDFYGAFAGRRFFSTQYLRHGSVPLYTPEPDLVHEVVGHAVQLADARVAACYEEVGRATARTESPEALGFLSRVFWFTIEFGVVKDHGAPRAFGAGLLSSFGELAVFSSAELRPLDFGAMGRTLYDITRYQPVLFAADSESHLLDEMVAFFGTYDDEAYARLR